LPVSISKGFGAPGFTIRNIPFTSAGSMSGFPAFALDLARLAILFNEVLCTWSVITTLDVLPTSPCRTADRFVSTSQGGRTPKTGIRVEAEVWELDIFNTRIRKVQANLTKVITYLGHWVARSVVRYSGHLYWSSVKKDRYP
jgi:hypothetical protein